MDITFIKLHPNREAANDLGESPNAVLRYGGQIQLLPFNKKPYHQVTTSSFGLTIGAYKVYLVRCEDGLEVEITEHVLLQPFTENGITQLKIRIAYLHQDYGSNPVYLKIERFGGADNGLKKYYSNEFIVTNDKSELTSRFDYIDKSRSIPAGSVSEQLLGFVQSIQLRVYFDDFVQKTEIETYYQITKSQNVNPRISLKEYAQYKTQIFDAWTFKLLARAFYTGKCYIGFIRNTIIEGLEYEKREGQSNISENTFITDPDEKDTIYIDNVIINPPPPLTPYLSSSGLLSSGAILASAQYEE